MISSERDIEDASRLLPDTPGGWELAVGALLVVAWALSAVGSIVSFAGFAVARDGDRLRIRRGLLQRSDAVVPVRRIHAVRVVEGTLRRPFGLATLRLEVAGYAEERSAARTLFPLLPRREVAAFLAELLPELADEPDGLTAPPARAARRYVLPPALCRPDRRRRRLPARPERDAVAAARRAAARAQRLVDASRPRAGACATAASRCARACSPARRCSPRRRGCSSTRPQQNPFQRRAGLADLAVAVGKGGRRASATSRRRSPPTCGSAAARWPGPRGVLGPAGDGGHPMWSERSPSRVTPARDAPTS